MVDISSPLSLSLGEEECLLDSRRRPSGKAPRRRAAVKMSESKGTDEGRDSSQSLVHTPGQKNKTKLPLSTEGPKEQTAYTVQHTVCDRSNTQICSLYFVCVCACVSPYDCSLYGEVTQQCSKPPSLWSVSRSPELLAKGDAATLRNVCLEKFLTCPTWPETGSTHVRGSDVLIKNVNDDSKSPSSFQV